MIQKYLIHSRPCWWLCAGIWKISSVFISLKASYHPVFWVVNHGVILDSSVSCGLLCPISSHSESPSTAPPEHLTSVASSLVLIMALGGGLCIYLFLDCWLATPTFLVSQLYSQLLQFTSHISFLFKILLTDYRIKWKLYLMLLDLTPAFLSNFTFAFPSHSQYLSVWLMTCSSPSTSCLLFMCQSYSLECPHPAETASLWEPSLTRPCKHDHIFPVHWVFYLKHRNHSVVL